jgi:phage terminase large subunit-like protein
VPDQNPPDAPSDPAFEALWLRVLEAWNEDKTHTAALEYALRTEQLPVIASRYRALKEDPLKAERAQKRLDAIVLAATQLMMSMKTEPRTKVPLPITLSAVGIFLFTLAFFLYIMWKR